MSALNQLLASYSATASPSLIALTNLALPATTFGGGSDGSFTLLNDGRLFYRDAGGTNVTVAGEWYAPGLTASIGASYERRYTTQAGTALSGSGEWTSLSANVAATWAFSAGGRALVEIRDVATSTVQASAQFWTAGFAP